jgi:hypothetical protein
MNASSVDDLSEKAFAWRTKFLTSPAQARADATIAYLLAPAGAPICQYGPEPDAAPISSPGKATPDRRGG